MNSEYDILITRPERAAQHLSNVLIQRGYTPLIEPMLTISAGHQQPPPLLNTGGVIFTSPNGVALTPYADLPRGWRLWPCYCVGARTAYVAEKYGWQNITAGTGNGAQLAENIKTRQPPATGHLLHISGSDLTAEPDATLRQSGYLVLNWVVYHASPVTALSVPCIEALNGSFRIVTFFSARTVATFAALLRDAELTHCCEQLTALCLSAPIAAAAKILPWKKIVTATAPHEAALLEALAQISK